MDHLPLGLSDLEHPLSDAAYMSSPLKFNAHAQYHSSSGVRNRATVVYTVHTTCRSTTGLFSVFTCSYSSATSCMGQWQEPRPNYIVSFVNRARKKHLSIWRRRSLWVFQKLQNCALVCRERKGPRDYNGATRQILSVCINDLLSKKMIVFLQLQWNYAVSVHLLNWAMLLLNISEK